MAWNQPPAHAVQKTLILSSLVTVIQNKKIQTESACSKCHKFDPWQPELRVLDVQRVTTFLRDIKQSMPNTGLKHFLEMNTSRHQTIQQPDDSFSPWNYVIFSHEKHLDFLDKFTNTDMLTSNKCYDCLKSMTLSQEEVHQIEKATREQADSKLWHSLHHRRLTSSRFDEILR